ncbi:LpxI family protein [Rickettsia endosymbiont of Cardiosporidium cionae]|uniref:LpxI family protein n=1 Tax=Rickettsia endosymbiont of Cardiosporidium cionae TaxID=2777155 RepID=UPI0018935694|nr:UDP-2,3-diacylglucosamine diphosphatase LpxI [Rickettsia endosymbiont of Cardiosporidium cionae]KAF8818251.1 hypothetical protein IHI24_000710 [Rickettsia endosymbiont of Cardiosporidium cionae]
MCSNFSTFNKLGIIAGNGDLPREIAYLYSKKAVQCFIAAIDGEADLGSISNYNFEIFPITSVGKIINFFYQHDVKNIILIGGIKRPNLSALKLDIAGTELLAQILKNKYFGDNKLLTVVAEYLEKKGFNVVSPLTILSSVNYGFLNYIDNSKLTKQDKLDIDLGIEIIKQLSKFDIGQSVVIENGYVVGIEAAEGTNNLIQRCALLKKNNHSGVFVKIPKLYQDLRLDLPTIGPTTILQLAESKIKILAVSRNTVIVKPQETKSLSLKLNIDINIL